MRTELTESEKGLILPKIREVLKTGKRWTDEAAHCPTGAIIKAVSAIEGVREEERFETNGWEWDWWQTFSHEGRNYTLSGSGYYGGHSFGLADE